MHVPPTVLTLGWATLAAAVPAIVVVVSTWLTYRASRFAQQRWTTEEDQARRDATQAALLWRQLYDIQSDRIAALERDLDKIKRSMRKRNLWDSSEAPPR